ncbi:MAG TPA: shikimate kinase [Bacteroidales bacterium]|nr:shikimate kinase [Bacteroidales bacterium]HPI86204.1 shikimate kinase [Bacteroidales bacterium]HPM92916.1 shikimate kinase [Bacteroidales bacterium]
MLIFLIGYMASGKSTVGRMLAEELKYRFIDLDSEFEKRTGASVPNYYTQFGELAFREKEREVLRLHLNDTDSVIATGGGTPSYHDNMVLMNRSGRTIFLDVPVNILVRRLAGEQSRRPVIKEIPDEELASFITPHLDSRRKYYDLASMKVQVINENAEEIVAQLIQRLSRTAPTL